MENHVFSCSPCSDFLPGLPATHEKWKRNQEGSFLFAAKLLDKVLEAGRRREQRAEWQGLHRSKDPSADAQKTQSYLPAALHPVKQEAALPSPHCTPPGRWEPWSNAVMCVRVCACGRECVTTSGGFLFFSSSSFHRFKRTYCIVNCCLSMLRGGFVAQHGGPEIQEE